MAEKRDLSGFLLPALSLVLGLGMVAAFMSLQAETQPQPEAALAHGCYQAESGERVAIGAGGFRPLAPPAAAIPFVLSKTGADLTLQLEHSPLAGGATAATQPVNLKVLTNFNTAPQVDGFSMPQAGEEAMLYHRVADGDCA